MDAILFSTHAIGVFVSVGSGGWVADGVMDGHWQLSVRIQILRFGFSLILTSVIRSCTRIAVGLIQERLRRRSWQGSRDDCGHCSVETGGLSRLVWAISAWFGLDW